MKISGPNKSFSDRVVRFTQRPLHSDDTVDRMPQMNLFERALVASTLTPERTAAVVVAAGISGISAWAAFKGIFSFEKILLALSRVKLQLVSTAALAMIFGLIQMNDQNLKAESISSQDNYANVPEVDNFPPLSSNKNSGPERDNLYRLKIYTGE